MTRRSPGAIKNSSRRTKSDMKDYPDFVDAYVDSAKFVSSGKPLNDDERMELQNQNIDKFYEDIMDKCIDYADMNYG